MNIKTQQKFDIIIAGGGLVGHCLAQALAPYDFNIAIIEKTPISVKTQFDYDARSIALSYGSRKIFEKWNTWEFMQSFVTPIQQVHVSDKGNFGFTRIDANKLNVAALGYVIEMHQLLSALLQAEAPFSNITTLCPATIKNAHYQSSTWELTVSMGGQQHQMTTPLLIAADGGNSMLRQSLNISVEEKDYEQTAIIANIGLSEHHQYKAFERFTQTGPMALLPLTEDRCALVWTVANDQVDSILSLTDSEFLDKLQERFGYRLGRFIKAGKRASFPLKAVFAKQQTKPGFVLLGNAAHTLHPVAGQGFNLCLRDIASLAQKIIQTRQTKQNLADPLLLDDYFQQRKRDQKRTFSYSDNLVQIFSTDFFPVTVLRNLGMVAFDMLPLCKNVLAKINMGMSDK